MFEKKSARIPGKRSAGSLRLLSLVLLAAAACTAPMNAFAEEASSSWVSYGPDGKLVYRQDSMGNRIMDFSSAGYGGGGVAIPEVPVVKTIDPSGGDDTAAIQNAIDEIAAMPLTNGFRGALLLGPGTFNASRQLNIAASGIVVRGSGSGSGGSAIQMNGDPFLLFNIAGSGSYATSNSANITDGYVPSGADSVTVDNVSGFDVGDPVLITRTVTAEWVHFMGMDTLVRDGKPQTWIAPGAKITTDRNVKSISGNTITLDAPLTDSFDSAYLGNPVGTIAKYANPGRISQVGLESFKVQAPPSVDAYRAVSMNAIIDAWARDLVIQDGANNFTISKASKQITVENVIINHTVSSTASAAPADFTCTGTQILFNRVQANDLQSNGKGSWGFVTQSQGTGPIVVLNSTFAENNGIAPHQRWTTGILVDHSIFSNPTNDAQGILFINRKTSGSGHGWPMGWSVAWNVISPKITVSQAPGTLNWCIGCIGSKKSSSDPEGIFESLGTNVMPGSLYLAQLQERLGPAALANIGYAPPALHVPADRTVEATGELTPVDLGEATADAGAVIANDAPASFPLGKTTVTWTATNKDGVTAVGTQTITVKDTIPPTIHGATTTEPNANGWYNHDVTVHFTATDSGSGIETVTPDLIVQAEGAGQAVEGVAVDHAGNTAKAVVDGINIDKSDPVISILSIAPAYTTSDRLTVTYDVYDTLSGVDGSHAVLDGKPVANGDTVNLAAMAGTHTLEVSATDKAGNTAAAKAAFTVSIDAAVEIHPETLNTKSQGGANAMTVYIEFPSGYNVARIDPATIKLNVNGTSIEAELKPTEIGDHDGDGIKDRMVKFDRQQVITALGNRSGNVNLAVTGQLTDGSLFAGSGTVQVIGD